MVNFIPLIPDFMVYAAMFYLSFIGVWCSRHRILIDPSYFLLFIPQGIMYLVFDIFKISPLERAAVVRLSLFLIPFAFSCIMTIAYAKSVKHE